MTTTVASLLANRVDFEELLDTLFEGVYFVDRSRTIVKWNSGAAKLTGFGFEEVEHRCCSDNILVHVDENGTELCKYGCPLLKTMQDGQVQEAKVFLRHKNGYRVPVQIRTAAVRDEFGAIIGAVETFRELADTECWTSRMAELEKAAFADSLTGIPNRRYVETQLARMCREYQVTSQPFAVCILDVDHFKATNDTWGHPAGDAALRTVSQTLQNCLRGSDVLGRWGGDEFLLLLPSTDLPAARAIVDRCRVLTANSSTPYQGALLLHTVSAGAAVMQSGETCRSLLARADAQLYKAKGLGRNCCCIE